MPSRHNNLIIYQQKANVKKAKMHDSTLVAIPPLGILPPRISEAAQTCGVHLRRFRSLHRLQPPAQKIERLEGEVRTLAY